MAPRILKTSLYFFENFIFIYIRPRNFLAFYISPKIFIFPPKEILGGSLLIVSPMGQGKELQFSSRAHDGRVNNILLY